jgi:hypothetical protein
MRKVAGVHSRFYIMHDQTPWENQQELMIFFVKM